MALTPEQWERVKALFASACEHDPNERAAFLESACAEPDVRLEVERLIALDDERSRFLRTGAGESPPRTQTCQPGDVLAGRFRIAKFLSRGGMGEVYEAE